MRSKRKLRSIKRFKTLWIARVDVEAAEGHDLHELLELEDSNNSLQEYVGAWIDVIVKADSIVEALDILEIGLEDMNYVIKFIDRIENMHSLVEHRNVDDGTVKDADMLLSNNGNFLIKDGVWTYWS